MGDSAVSSMFCGYGSTSKEDMSEVNSTVGSHKLNDSKQSGIYEDLSEPRGFKENSNDKKFTPSGGLKNLKTEPNNVAMSNERDQVQDSQLLHNGRNAMQNIQRSRQGSLQSNFLFNSGRQDLLGSILNNYLINNPVGVTNNASMIVTGEPSQNLISQLADSTYPSYFFGHNQDSYFNNINNVAGSDNLRTRGDSLYLPPPISSQNSMAHASETDTGGTYMNNVSRNNSIFSSLIQLPGSSHNSLSEGSGATSKPGVGRLPSSLSENAIKMNDRNNYPPSKMSALNYGDNLNMHPVHGHQDLSSSRKGSKTRGNSSESYSNNSFWEGLNNVPGSISGVNLTNEGINEFLLSLANNSIDFSQMNNEQRRDSILKFLNEQQTVQDARKNSFPANTKLKEDIFVQRKDQYYGKPGNSIQSNVDNMLSPSEAPHSPKATPRPDGVLLEPSLSEGSRFPIELSNTGQARMQCYNLPSSKQMLPISGNRLENKPVFNRKGNLEKYQLSNVVPKSGSIKDTNQLRNSNSKASLLKSGPNSSRDTGLVPAEQIYKTEYGKPLLGATKIDQLMLVIQARDNGLTNPIQQSADGSILASPEVTSSKGLIPKPESLVGCVSKASSPTGDDDELGSGQKRRKTKKKQCPYCFKYFNQSTHLEVHVRSHIGYKPFECSFCHKRFTQGGNLRTHYRLHTGEKPFTCDICNRSFSRKGNLAAHKLTHDNLKPYKCKLDDCDKSFTQLGNLKSHQNRFHLATLNHLTEKLAKLTGEELERLPEDEKSLLDYFKSLYKNSNKGIRGRGKRSMNASSSTPKNSQTPTTPW